MSGPKIRDLLRRIEALEATASAMRRELAEIVDDLGRLEVAAVETRPPPQSGPAPPRRSFSEEMKALGKKDPRTE